MIDSTKTKSLMFLLIKVHMKTMANENWKLINTDVLMVDIILNKLFWYNKHFLNVNFK